MTEETFEERALADDLTAYVNNKHTQEECIGFIDGYKAALAKLKNLRLGVVVGQSEQLFCKCGFEKKGNTVPCIRTDCDNMIVSAK